MNRCLGCDGELEPGFMLDNGDHGTVAQAQWASGAPDPSKWKISVIGAGTRRLPVVTYRCSGCGRLASFAPTAA